MQGVRENDTTDRFSFRFHPGILGLLLFLTTVAVYSPVCTYPFFSLDDNFYILSNTHIQHGLNWTTVRWAFTSFDHANWIPLSFLSHALDYQLFSRNPAGYHAVNIFLHGLNAVLLFWVLRRATGFVGRSFVVASLFALHPLNVEAVAWIAERKTVLSMFFFLLALGAYQWYAEQPKLKRLAVVVGLFGLGITAKAQIITFPFALLLWDFWPLKRMFPPSAESSPYPRTRLVDLVIEKTPLFAVCLLDAYFTMLSEGVARPRFWPPLMQRLCNALYSYARYIKLTFWPTNLAPMYPNPGDSLTRWQIVTACLVLVTITALVIWFRNLRYPLVGWLWFLGMLAPTIQIIQFGKEGMADRFAYQALIGLFILLCWGLADFSAQRQVSGRWLVATASIVLIGLALTTYHQIGYWKTSNTMWNHAREAIPNHWMAYDQLGLELLDEGKRDEALPYFQKAAEILPNDSLSNTQIALTDLTHNDPADAILHYKRALQDPAFPYDQLKIALGNMSYAYRTMGDIPDAIEYAKKASAVPE